jgi:hypothetical protein
VTTGHTTQLPLHPQPSEMQQLFAAIAGNRAAVDAFVSVCAATLFPTNFRPANLASTLTHAQPR